LDSHGEDRTRLLDAAGALRLTQDNIPDFLDVVEGRWFEDDLTGDYVPGSVDDPRRDLVKRLKAGDPAAMAASALLLSDALDKRPRRGTVSVVAVPGHAAAINRTTETL